MSRCELLRIVAILGASVILGGCGELSKAEKRAQKHQLRSAKQSREERRNLLKKIKNGYEGSLSPIESKTRNRFNQ